MKKRATVGRLVASGGERLEPLMNTSYPAVTSCLRAIIFLALPLGGCVDVNNDGGSDDDSADGTADGGGDGGGGNGGGDGGDGGNGADAPSEQEVAACRGVCDDLLFFDCLDSTSHEACYGVCPERSAADIDLFSACADNTLPSCSGCYDNFVDAAPADSGNDDGADGDPPPTSCVDACSEWVGAGCEALGEIPSCEAFCNSISTPLQDVVVECIENRDGCTLPDECIFDKGGAGGR